MSTPLLMTKLYIPLPGKHLVGRARLIEKLDQCLNPGCRLALVSAPAGFGKTTLVSAWAAGAAGRVVAWLSIDEGDNDPVIFWTYLIAALDRQQPGIGQKALSLLAAQGSDLEGKLASFINDLYQIVHPCVLVLDDYHLIRNPGIHQSLSYFMEHLPLHVHLVIASRTDPPLPLALLRGRGQLIEIRLNELRFSNEDADTYLNAGMGLNLALPSIQRLNHKAEGWIAGLQMAALAMQDGSQRGAAAFQNTEKQTDFVASFSGSNRYILDYLIEEVLNRQPEIIQNFLIRTSLLEQLCGPLCDALLAEDAPGVHMNSQATLEYLESCNLFLFPLDQERYWYRYHQLFADLLRKRLAQIAPGAVQTLHRRAMAWYEQNGLISRAIQHAFQVPDFPKAAALVAQITEELWGRGEHATLLTWMDALPDEEKQRYPHLLTFQVSMLISAGKLQEAEACIRILERYILAALEAHSSGESPEQRALLGKIAELRTYIASFYGDRPAVFAHAQAALQALTRAEDAGKRCGILLVLGHAYLIEGTLEAADRTLVEAIAVGKKAHKPHMVLSGLANLAMVLWFQGDLSRTAQVCQEGLLLIEQYSLERSSMAADIYLGWGEVLRERGALDEAKRLIEQGLALAQEQHFIWQTAWGYQAQVRLLLAQGNLADAEIAAQAAENWVDTHPVPAHFACEAAGLRAGLWLRQGKVLQAERHLTARGIQVAGEVQFPRQSEYLALARLLWIQGDRAGAARLLEQLSHWAETHGQTGVRIAALLLQALVSQAGGDLAGSRAFLWRALELAEPDGYLRVFVDEGEPIAALLREAVKQGGVAAYARQLLAAFPDQPQTGPAASRPVEEPGQLGRGVAGPETLPLVEPLSRREMETLLLIAEGHSNKEIAQKLFISLRTVKYYSTGLYNKLGVDSRTQAVKRARELGLL